MYYDLPLIHDKTPTSGKSLQHYFLLCFPAYCLVFALKEHKRSVYLEAESCLCILDLFNKGGWIMPLIEATNWFFWLPAAYLSIRAPLEEKALNSLSLLLRKDFKALHIGHRLFSFSWVSALRYRTGGPIFFQIQCLSSRTQTHKHDSLPWVFSSDSQVCCSLTHASSPLPQIKILNYAYKGRLHW